jgi:hypothetical protein
MMIYYRYMYYIEEFVLILSSQTMQEKGVPQKDNKLSNANYGKFVSKLLGLRPAHVPNSFQSM